MGIPFPQAHCRCDSDAFIDALIPGEFSFLYKSGRIIYHIVHTNVLSSAYIGKNFLSPRCPSAQLSSVTLLCSTLCDPMDCNTKGFPVHHQIPGLAQTQVNDDIQPSHSLSSPSFAFSLSQHQGLFKWVSSSHHGGQSIGTSASASVLPVNIQDWFPLGWTGWISLQSKGRSESSLKPHVKSINSMVLSFLYGPALTSIHNYWKNHSFDDMDLCWQSNVSAF